MQAVLTAHRLEHIDVLKVDCEAGEHDLISAAASQALERVDARR